jgi:DNA replication protein DnaC
MMTTMTTDELYSMLVGMRIRTFADVVLEIAEDPGKDDLAFLDKVALAAEAEMAARADRRVAKYNKEARFHNPLACMEDIEYLPSRTLNRDTMNRLARCEFIADNHNVICISKSGCGKSFVIQALGNAACRHGYRVRYIRHADLNRELNIARSEGNYYERMDALKAIDLLVIDDLFLQESTMPNITDLFEIIEARMGRAPAVIASQLTPEEWHLRIDTKIIADALLDRIVHNSYRIDIEGPNMRKHFANKHAS